MKDNKPGLVVLREIKKELTPKEVKIVEFIEQNQENVMRYSITELAIKCNSSESSIVRLCKKIGYKGFQEFKIALAQNTSENYSSKYLQQDVEPGDSKKDIAIKVFNASAQALMDTVTILTEEKIENGMKLIAEAEKISFFGVGGAGVVATDAYHRFCKLKKPCQLFTDYYSQVNKSLVADEHDLIIAISHSGKTRDILVSLQNAKNNNAKIIAITQFGNSPITQLADVVFFTSSKETAFRHDAMASRIAEMAILDSLFTCSAFDDYQEVVERYERSWEMFQSTKSDNIKNIKKCEKGGE
ncbi:MurR/RpiR family transcriptional regulator [Frisingicoccus sp.]|uniref:MurR/RpiR family transcriptional regulator n=1 Tax=Frisingicoccus sp. TaxID=1918627 RepID=UPI003AB4AF09